MAFAIETHNITKKYPDKSISNLFSRVKKGVLSVYKVNLRIARGEACGLLGKNGAGKTTLIKMLCSLVIPTSGTARVNGYDILKQDSGVRASIGFISSDERSFYWRLSGRENLLFFASLQNITPREAKKRIDYLLQLVHMEKKADAIFKGYSTGMKQKLAIARGLLHNPEILFMDEPSRGLDPGAANDIRLFVRKELVEKSKKTILIATHDLVETSEICDSVAIMHQGRILVKKSINELKEKDSLKKLFLGVTQK